MPNRVDELRTKVIERAVGGAGVAPADHRKAAFANRGVPDAAAALVAKVAANAWKVTDDDVAAARAAGLSEDSIFELVICASLGQATRQLDAARAALAAVPVTVTPEAP